MNTALDRFRELLESAGRRVTPNGTGRYKAQCPCHDDRTESMSFENGDRAGVVAKCHAGSCGASLIEMLEELDATVADRDLILSGDRHRRSVDGRWARSPQWIYRDERGTPLHGTTRIDGPDGKRFIQLHYDAGEWRARLGSVRRVPYRLPECLAALALDRTLYVPEGEKCVDALVTLGFEAATCNPMGAGKWRPAYAGLLKSARAVRVLADADQAGRQHAAAVARSFTALGVLDVRVLELPGDEGSDVADWVAVRCDTTRDELRAELERLADEAPLVQRLARALAAESRADEVAGLGEVDPKRNDGERPEAAKPAPEPVTVPLDRLQRASMTAADFIALDIPPVRSLLGDGVIVAGEITAIAGKPGMSKTMLAIQLGIAMARGDDFFELPTQPCRVGMLSLELSDAKLQERIRNMVGDDHRGLENLYICPRGAIGGVVDFNPEAGTGDLAALAAWIREPVPGAAPLDLIVIDALSRASTLPEVDLKPLLRALDQLRGETGVAPFVIHHEKKGDGRDKSGGDDLDAFRGDSALVSFATCCIRVKLTGDTRTIVFAKVTNGETPPPIYFKLAPHGIPEPAPDPILRSKDKGDRTTADVLAAVQAAGAEGISKGLIAQRVEKAERTVTTHLTKLGPKVRMLGAGSVSRWVAAEDARGESGKSGKSEQSPLSFPD